MANGIRAFFTRAVASGFGTASVCTRGNVGRRMRSASYMAPRLQQTGAGNALFTNNQLSADRHVQLDGSARPNSAYGFAAGACSNRAAGSVAGSRRQPSFPHRLFKGPMTR